MVSVDLAGLAAEVISVWCSELANLARDSPVAALSSERWRCSHLVGWHRACRRCAGGPAVRGGSREGRPGTATHQA